MGRGSWPRPPNPSACLPAAAARRGPSRAPGEGASRPPGTAARRRASHPRQESWAPTLVAVRSVTWKSGDSGTGGVGRAARRCGLPVPAWSPRAAERPGGARCGSRSPRLPGAEQGQQPRPGDASSARTRFAVVVGARPAGPLQPAAKPPRASRLAAGGEVQPVDGNPPPPNFRQSRVGEEPSALPGRPQPRLGRAPALRQHRRPGESSTLWVELPQYASPVSPSSRRARPRTVQSVRLVGAA